METRRENWLKPNTSQGLTNRVSRLHIPDMQQDEPQNHEEIEATEAPEAAAETAVEQDPWEQLEAEATKWKEVSLRTAAEMENLRKRTAREREVAIRYANQRLLEELLPVIDNFEMGMLAAAQDTSSMIYIGMDMVRKQLNEFLSNLGVEEIPVTGQFNPNLHDAVSEEPSNTPEGEILRVTRRGYKLRDRLLRPASVVVAAASSLP